MTGCKAAASPNAAASGHIVQPQHPAAAHGERLAATEGAFECGSILRPGLSAEARPSLAAGSRGGGRGPRRHGNRLPQRTAAAADGGRALQPRSPASTLVPRVRGVSNEAAVKPAQGARCTARLPGRSCHRVGVSPNCRQPQKPPWALRSRLIAGSPHTRRTGPAHGGGPRGGACLPQRLGAGKALGSLSVSRPFCGPGSPAEPARQWASTRPDRLTALRRHSQPDAASGRQRALPTPAQKADPARPGPAHRQSRVGRLAVARF